jgi:hypothetical protein
MGCRSRPRFEWDTDFTDFTDFFLRADSRTGSRFDFVVARWVAGDGLVLVGHGFHGFHGFFKKKWRCIPDRVATTWRRDWLPDASHLDFERIFGDRSTDQAECDSHDQTPPSSLFGYDRLATPTYVVTSFPLDEKTARTVRLFSPRNNCSTCIICVTFTHGDSKCPPTLSDSQMNSPTGSR